MKFVATKTAEQLDLQALHRVREFAAAGSGAASLTGLNTVATKYSPRRWRVWASARILLSKEVNLDTHIADVVNLVKWEGLENVCLVAWSYAGFVGAGALESIGDRVSSIVWLDAFLPTDGQKVADLAGGGPLPKSYRQPLIRARQALVRRRWGWLV
jgi:hypothetical protein